MNVLRSESSITGNEAPGADAASGIFDAPVVPTTDEIVGLKAARELDEAALRTIFLEARTANGFLDYPVRRELLAHAVELALLGPTSANGLPLRLVFVESAEAKEKLRPSLRAGNLEKTMAAPVTAIVATDLKFYEQFPRTFPDRGETLKGTLAAMETAAQREISWDNAVLQMAYFIVALRSLGLDAGPMVGLDRKIVDEAFFPDGNWVSQYLINIGYGDDSKLFPRLPRFNVDEIARFA
jgi:3-hydroxypropanoate dehydrogenase